jgi:hypothetical protein
MAKAAEQEEPKTDLLDGEGKGVGPQKKNPTIEKAARKYVETRNERMALTKKETDARAVLMNAMHEADVERYRYDNQEIKLEEKEKISVRTIDEDEE